MAKCRPMREPGAEADVLVIEVRELKARLAALERRRARARWWVLAAVVGASVAYGQLTVFAPDTPAVASQVNANFALLKSWIEAKVGPTTVPVSGPQPVT